MTQLFSLSALKAGYSFITQDTHSASDSRPEQLPTLVIVLIATAFIIIQVCSALTVTGGYQYKITPPCQITATGQSQ